MAASADFDFGDINLNDDWDAEIPGGVDEDILKIRNQDLEEVLVVGAAEPENEEIKVEITNDWKDELEELIYGGNMVVLSEWTSERGSNEHLLSSSTARQQKKECPICFKWSSCKLDRHVISNHLPWFAYPRNACWQCKVPVPQISRFDCHEKAAKCFGGQFWEIHQQEWVSLVNRMLRFFAEEFKVPGVLALFDYVRATPELCPPHNQPSTQDLEVLMDLYQEANGFVKHDYVMRPPNCVAALLHWRTLALLISRLSPEKQEALRQIEEGCTFLGDPLIETAPRCIPAAADAHCHVDLLLQHTQRVTYADAAEDFMFADMEIDLDIIIPCYAFPTMFPTHGQLELLPPGARNFAAGFHPRSAQREYPRFMPTF